MLVFVCANCKMFVYLYCFSNSFIIINKNCYVEKMRLIKPISVKEKERKKNQTYFPCLLTSKLPYLKLVSSLR
ncbi:hypothetical protein T190607A01A_10926 [Tenacibaculum sp. 190524A05c]|uniref:Uncharacterized protein n=1 Tax=Tenacibaculum platacis TaxID=3137852 RepID=A0ABM9NUQ0_9FLAO